jgi:SAM-dependent methyltransferase
MSFSIPPAAYDHYMGRYSRRLAPLLADFAHVRQGQHVLDVGCGPGALTAHLAGRVGAGRVAAAEPSPGFARACIERVPGADVRIAPSETLPWSDDNFDVIVSQLVVSFVKDADAAVSEMRRVAVPGGTIAACTWDYAGQMQMLTTFWNAAETIDPEARAEGRTMPYIDPDSLRELWRRAALSDIDTAALVVEVTYADFDDYWEPFLTGAGVGGQYCVSLDAGRREALREECFRALGEPSGSFPLTARSWAVRGTASTP